MLLDGRITSLDLSGCGKFLACSCKVGIFLQLMHFFERFLNFMRELMNSLESNFILAKADFEFIPSTGCLDYKVYRPKVKTSDSDIYG